MKTILNTTLAVAMAGLGLVSCTPDEEQNPSTPLDSIAQESKLVGYDPTTCNLIQSFGTGELPRSVDMIEEERAIMLVKAQKRGHNGKYLKETSAVLLNPDDWESDLITPINAQMAGVYGLLTVGNESGNAANLAGGRVILDFSPVSSVTMKTLVVADIDEADKGSKVQLFSRTGQLLDQQALPVTGDKDVGFVTFDNIPGVAKIIVTFGDERKRVGSGAIARLQLCIEGEGAEEFCYDKISSVWVEYTGRTPANVTVKAKQGRSAKVVYSKKGMKPGTMFKLADKEGFGESLILETNRKNHETISLECNGSYSLKKQYGNFRVVEARSGTDYPLLLQ